MDSVDIFGQAAMWLSLKKLQSPVALLQYIVLYEVFIVPGGNFGRLGKTVSCDTLAEWSKAPG